MESGSKARLVGGAVYFEELPSSKLAGDPAMSGRVWFPGKSVPEGEDGATQKVPQGQSEGQEKRKNSRIARRTTPTVDFSALNVRTRDGARTAIAETGEEDERQNYSTIEKSSYRRNVAALDCSSGQPLAGGSDFCGWETDRKPLARQGLAASSSLSRKYAADRSSLSTPADGHRSGAPSRACSRAGGRRKGDTYVFQHLPDARRYIEDYCKQHSFTALNVPRVDNTIREAEGDKVREKTQGGERSRGVERGGESGRRSHSGERRDSLYLQQLARRLGVRESIQLHHRSTTPSITKRNRAAADLLVCPQEDKTAAPEEEQVEGQNVETTSEHISDNQTQGPKESQPAPSRGVSASSGRPQSTIAPLELPRILQRVKVQDKTLSTTSVSKYLRISSHAQHSIDLGEEEAATEDGSHGSGGETACSSSGCALVEEPGMPAKESTVLSLDNHGGAVGEYSISVSPQGLNLGSRDPQPPLFDEIWRNRVLAQKAQALGLLSRDWTRATHARKMAGLYDTKVTSRPPTREAKLSRPPTRAHPHTEPRRSTRDTHPPDNCPPTRDTRQPGPSTRDTANPLLSTRQAAASRPPTRETSSYRHTLSKQQSTMSSQPTNPHSDKKDNDKMEQLKSIYRPPSSSQTDKQSKRSPSRLRHDRCESRSTSRRPARGGTQNQRREKKGHFSQPATRAGKKLDTSLPAPLAAEESQYWNEVTPQFQVGGGAQLRVESRPLTRGRQTPVHVPLHTDQQYRYSRTVSHLPQPPQLLTGRHRPSEGSLKSGPIAGRINTYIQNQQTRQKSDGFLEIRVTSST